VEYIEFKLEATSSTETCGAYILHTCRMNLQSNVMRKKAAHHTRRTVSIFDLGGK
jgi:hypothetical protein